MYHFLIATRLVTYFSIFFFNLSLCFIDEEPVTPFFNKHQITPSIFPLQKRRGSFPGNEKRNDKTEKIQKPNEKTFLKRKKFQPLFLN
jgi:hypothetical protein